ncbi:MAG: AAA domain protein [Caudoviricetes sp.]|nr:MAG: AAA domain protein [Caudoviricetes sp.]
MCNIIVMIGLPASGKSTFRNYICSNYTDMVVISNDDCLEYHAKLQGVSYNAIFHDNDVQDTCKNYLKDLFSTSLEERKNILIDKTNLTLKSRNRILSILPKEYKVHYVWFDIPRYVIDFNIFERYINTGKNIPKKVIDDMEKFYQEPVETEYDTLTIINEDYNYNFILE